MREGARGGPPARQLTTAVFLAAVRTAAGVVMMKVLGRVLGGRVRASLLATAASPAVFWLAVRLGRHSGCPSR